MVPGDRLEVVSVLSPLSTGWRATPKAAKLQMSAIAGQIASMDRFVMGDPVREKVEALHAIGHVAPNLWRVTF